VDSTPDSGRMCFPNSGLKIEEAGGASWNSSPYVLQPTDNDAKKRLASDAYPRNSL
jgi:hypothetical protein